MNLSGILLLVGMVLLYIASLLPKPYKEKGEYGEYLIEEKLGKIHDIYGKVLRNLYVPKTQDEASEIDIVFLTTKGIIVIESKNYSGWIFGDENNSYWTASISRKTKNKFYNPIKQNISHMKYLQSYIERYFPEKPVPLYSLVVFSERCELKNIKVSDNNLVIKRDIMNTTIRKMLKEKEEVLTKKEVNKLYDELYILTCADEEFKREHIKTIEDKYIKHQGDKTPRITCPNCGKRLILKENYKGNKYYECISFPKCHYSRIIE